jgi:hypothetical protein
MFFQGGIDKFVVIIQPGNILGVQQVPVNQSFIDGRQG